MSDRGLAPQSTRASRGGSVSSGRRNGQLYGRAETDEAAPKRLVFRSRRRPDVWVIAAIVALVAALGLFIGGVVSSQGRGVDESYESVYVPEDTLSGAQK